MYQINVSDLNCENEKLKTYGVTFEGREIHDISPDRGKVEDFIELLNRLELSPIHIDEVIEDFLLE